MKKNLVFVLLAFLSLNGFLNSADAFSDDPADNSSNNLANLIYYPHMGHFRFDANIASDINASSFGRSESFTDIGLFASYGAFVDGLRFSVTTNDNIYAYSSSGSSTYYTGFTNPEFTSNYRFLDSSPAGLSADVSLSVTPSFGTRTEAMAGSPGNAAQGFPSMDLAGVLFFDHGINELSLSASLFHAFGGSGFDQVNQDTYTSSSYWQLSTTLTDRVHLAPKFFVEGQAEFQFGHSIEYIYPSNTGTTDQYPLRVYPTFEVGYLQSKQCLMVAYMTGYTYTENSSGINTGYQASHLVYAISWGLRTTFEF